MFDYLMGTSLLEAVGGGFGGMTAEDDAYMESIEGIPCYDDPDDAFARISMENVENFYAIANAITIDEFAEYIATNEEVIYEEGRIKKIFNTIKAWIKKAWAKIKGVFEKVFQKIESFIRNDKDFVEKYKSTVKSKKTTISNGINLKTEDVCKKASELYGKLIDLFNNNATKQFESVTNNITKYIEGDSNKIKKVSDTQFKPDEVMNKIRGGLFDEKKLTDEELNTKLKKLFDPEREKVTVEGSVAIQEIADAKKTKAGLKSLYEQTKMYFNTMIKEADIMEKTAKDADKKGSKEANVMSIVGKWNSCCKSCISIANKIDSKAISALDKIRAQNRAACVKMAKGDTVDDKKSKNESASFLDSLELI